MPRKENASLTAEAQQEQLTEGMEAYELPKSVVTKIAKSALPDNAKLQKETVLALVKSSTVFINYLAATAHDIATSRQHKSISASDILNALDMIEFSHLAPLLEEQHKAWLSLSKTEKGKKSAASSASAQANGSTSISANTTTTPSTTTRPTTSSNKNGLSASGTTLKVPNGNPYPNVNPKPSNPYPSISSSDSSHDDNENKEKDSPFTSEPLAISKSTGGVGGKVGGAGDGSGPMDVDDDNDDDQTE